MYRFAYYSHRNHSVLFVAQLNCVTCVTCLLPSPTLCAQFLSCSLACVTSIDMLDLISVLSAKSRVFCFIFSVRLTHAASSVQQL